MNEKEKAKKIEKIKKEWVDEILKLEPVNIHNALNNSLNSERMKLEEKYRKKIAEIEKS